MSYCGRCGKWNGAIAAPAGTEPTWCICSNLQDTKWRDECFETHKIADQWKEEYLNASADAMKFAGELERIREAAGVRADSDLVDWVNRIRGRCDTYDWERQTLDRDLTATRIDLDKLSDKIAKLLEIVKATKEHSLEEAWQRVDWGDVDYDPESIYCNMKMFDYPQYTWHRLEKLIKGIK